MSSTMQAIIVNGEVVGYFSPNASSIEFDNTGTNLSSTDVQDAIVELDNNVIPQLKLLECNIPTIDKQGNLTQDLSMSFKVTQTERVVPFQLLLKTHWDTYVKVNSISCGDGACTTSSFIANVTFSSQDVLNNIAITKACVLVLSI
jgi:hypothetical protein